MASEPSPRDKILVLSEDFQEIGNSTPLVRVCSHLVQAGHHVLCTTTTTVKANQSWFRFEEANVQELNTHNTGKIELLRPEISNTESNVDWVATKLFRVQYMSLLTRGDFHTIIAHFPTTAETGVELKRHYADTGTRVRLVFVATSSIDTKVDNATQNLINEADVIWSLGPNVFRENRQTFETLKIGGESHYKFTLGKGLVNFQIPRTRSQRPDVTQISTFWQTEGNVFENGNEEREYRMKCNDYRAVAMALGDIAKARHLEKKSPQKWNIYNYTKPENCLKLEDDFKQETKQPTLNDLKQNLDPGAKTYEINHPKLPRALPNFYRQCLQMNKIVLAPEQNETTFNFPAWVAILAGIPTLVSSKSGIGSILQGIRQQCPDAENALVYLSGDLNQDAKVWKDAFYSNIYNDFNRAQTAAQNIAEYLRQNQDFWKSIDRFVDSIEDGKMQATQRNVSVFFLFVFIIPVSHDHI